MKTVHTTVLIASARPSLVHAWSQAFARKGVDDVRQASEPETVAAESVANPASLLVVDVALGEAYVATILALNARTPAGRLRPVIVAANEPDERLVAIAAEYAVDRIVPEELPTRVFSEQIWPLFQGVDVTIPGRNAILRALAMRQRGDTTSAVRVLVEAAQDKTPSRVLCELTDLYIALGRWRDALAVADRVPADEPSPRQIFLRARCLLKMGDLRRASYDLESANGANPLEPDRWSELGYCFLKMDRVARSRAAFERAVALDPMHPLASRGLQVVRWASGDTDDALQLLKDARDPVETGALLNLCAISNARSGRLQKAVELYTLALTHLETRPDLQARLFFNIALAHQRNADTSLAAKNLTEAVRLDPDYERALGMLKKVTPAVDEDIFIEETLEAS